jgi:hypothetical protein
MKKGLQALVSISKDDLCSSSLELGPIIEIYSLKEQIVSSICEFVNK